MKLQHTYFYYPDNIESNEAVINFEEQSISMRKIQTTLGRNNRFVLTENSEETTLSMRIEAAKEVLEKSNTSINDIDMVIFVSTPPEHHIPCDLISKRF